MSKPKLIIVSAPSGAGKSTLCQRLLKDYPEKFKFSISSTTRKPRGQEQNGKEYHFLSKPEFQKGIEAGQFAEWANVHDEFYGTSKSEIDAAFLAGKSIILDIDVQGAASLRKSYPNQHIDIFVAPPSLEVLEQRLRSRGTDPDAVIAKRMKNAKSEMDRMNEFTTILINDDLDETYKKFKDVVFGK
ncbi:MAG: guanylate kinase [Xanthomonadaceae bacterium]|nr:guanylate kinase [Xanthomonadaceae bacterium]